MLGIDKEVWGMFFGLLTILVNGYIAYYMRKLEKNTNSMKDALVASTATSSHALGKLEGKAESRTESIVDAAGQPLTHPSPINAPGAVIKMDVKEVSVKEMSVDELKHKGDKE